MHQHGDPAGAGQHVLEQCEPLGAQLRVEERLARDVVGGPREAAGEARGDRVPGRRDDDRNRRTGAPNRAHGNPDRHDDVRFERNEVVGEPLKQVGPPLSALHCELDVLTLDIPQLAQALAELREQTRHSVVQNADERHPVWLLRSRRQWRREESDGERGESHRARDHHAAAGRCSLVMPAIFRQPSILRNLTWPLATRQKPAGEAVQRDESPPHHVHAPPAWLAICHGLGGKS